MILNDPNDDIWDQLVEPHGCFGPALTMREWWATLSPEEQEHEAALAIGRTFAPLPDFTALAAAFRAAVGPPSEESNRTLALTADFLQAIYKFENEES